MNSVISRCVSRMILVFAAVVLVASLALAADTAPAAAPAAPAKAAPVAKAVTAPAPEKPMVAPQAAEIPLPPGQITIGGLFGDGEAEGYGDVLIPVLAVKSGLLFVEPRGSLNDSDEQEFNIGVGYRQLFPDKNFIVGANAFYDYRETGLDNSFDQVGFGVEFLSKWVDARANYYLPQDDIKAADRYVLNSSRVTESARNYDAPTGSGDQIIQTSRIVDSTYDVETLQHFRMYEQAMEGFDCEVGALLPIPVVQDYADVKAFAGYYNFDSDIGGNVSGFKGRLEVRPMPSVYLDATYHEDKELYGSSFSVGARAVLPFDLVALSHGKTPFAGALDGFKFGKASAAPISSRLTEMVVRDLHIRTDASDPEEIIADRLIKAKKLVEQKRHSKETDVLYDDVTFVDFDNEGQYEDGTWEHPYGWINEGIGNRRGKMVYVRDAQQQYYENVIMQEGLVLWGSGCPIYGKGDRFLGGVYPVVNGGGDGPGVTLASDSTVAGLEIVQPVQGADKRSDGWSGIYGHDVTDVTILHNYIHDTETGIELRSSHMDEFNAVISENQVSDNGMGMNIHLWDVPNVDILMARNTVVNNCGPGVIIDADYRDVYKVPEDDSSFVLRVSGDYSGNGCVGIGLEADGYSDAAALFIDTRASGNECTGIDVDLSADDMALALFASSADLGRMAMIGQTVLDAVGIGDIGLDEIMDELGDLASPSTPMEANCNGDQGIYADVNGYVSIAALLGVTANHNGLDWDTAKGQRMAGIDISQEGYISAAALVRCTANDNNGAGIGLNTIASQFALEALVDVTANDNTDFGIYGNVVAYDGVAGAIVMSSDPLLGLAKPIGDMMGYPMDFSAIPQYGQVQANGNGMDGIFLDVDAAGPAFGVVLDVSANGNGWGRLPGVKEDDIYPTGSGISLGVHSWNSAAIALVGSTEPILDLAGPLVSGLMDTEMDLSDVRRLGPLQANDNAGNGLNIRVNGDEAAILAVLGVETVGNGYGDIEFKQPAGGNGIYADVGSEDGAAFAAFIRVNASGNDGSGIEAGTYAPDLAVQVFVDVTANDNDGFGIYGNVVAYDGVGGAIVMASDPLVNLAGPLSETMGYPMDFSGIPQYGQVQANGNGMDGIFLDVDAAGPAFGVVLDVMATGNGWSSMPPAKPDELYPTGSGISLGVHSWDSDAFALVGSTEALLDEVVPALDLGELPFEVSGASDLGPLVASGNYGNGIMVNVQANGDAMLGVAGVEAMENGMFPLDAKYIGGAGINATVDSLYGDAMAGFGWINASENGGCGINASVHSSYGDALLGGINLTANDNGNDGLHLNVTADNYDSYLLLAGVEANGNGACGVDASVSAYYDSEVAMTAIQANGNYSYGVNLSQSSSYGDAYTWISSTAASDMDASDLEPYISYLPAGGIEVNQNGSAGLNVSASASDGSVYADIGDVTANSNQMASVSKNGGGANINVSLNSYGWDEDASLSMSDITANGCLYGNGIYATVYSSYGDTTATFTDVTVAGNDGNGIYVDQDPSCSGGYGSGLIEFNGVTTTGNDGDGIYAYVQPDGNGNSTINLDHVVATGNSSDGLDLSAYSYDGDTTIDGQYVTASGNGENGVVVRGSAEDSLDMEFVVSRFFGNGSYDMSNSSYGTIDAEHNWWGSDADPGSHISGSVDYDPWLSSDPGL